MRFEVDAQQKKAAAVAHKLFVSNIVLLHLLLTPAIIVMDLGSYALFVSLLLSLAVITFIYTRSQNQSDWFVEMHWKLAFARCQLLIIGYALTVVFLFVAWVVTNGMDDAQMKDILYTAITRTGIVPTLILVIVAVVFEVGGMKQVARGEVPNDLVKKNTPPTEFKALDDEV